MKVLTVFNLIGWTFLGLTGFRGKAKPSCFFNSGQTFGKLKKVYKKENLYVVFGTTVAFEIEANSSKKQ